ncbi:hypothetical protein Pmani_011327 [Petrolisthes manimaculis]|uniref:Potassium voltage-gated channel subfamily KQT member 5 n=1 Tax=Petrolisthes manimaculis TaxID=1843537 RepID=A0AAE1Q0X5_9EUCA|nr:hypothetical protein Pmani_011327 [Petrolisthes manimaculis]
MLSIHHHLHLLTLSVLSTVEEYEKQATNVLFYSESFVVVWFSIEYILRLWSSGCRSRYQGFCGRMKYAKRPFCCIDMVTIVASVIVLANGSGGQVVSAVRGLRFFQILRMVRMDRRGGTWKLLGSVVYAHRQELLTTLYIGFLGLIFSSFLVYLVEKDDNPNFKNFPDALWWGVITLCTVGYGDAVPASWSGKMIASGCALLGISFFALPAGILGSGFALKVQQQQRQKHMIRRRQPAATLIQCLWRCYAADEHSMSVATWKIHQVPLPSPPSFKHNASFVTRLPTIRRHRNAHSPSIRNRHTDSNHALENLVNSSKLNASHSEDSVTKESSDAVLTKKNSDVHLRLAAAALLTPMVLSEAGTPTSGTPVDQESGHFPLVLANLLQKEFGGAPPHTPRRARSPTRDEDEDQPRVLQLTNQHKAAIRSIRKIRYFLARRKFKEALKPYDVKDVIEQYSSGHADLLTRVKYLHGRLDQILGKQGSKAKDVYESKICLASRIVKVERQVDDIEAKLDQLIDMYMEDRKRLLALPSSFVPGAPPLPGSPDSCSSGPTAMPPIPTPSSLAVPGAPPPYASTLKPKPILVDKQASEPNTPTNKNFEKPMTRGNSDVSQRMKKRVTLSSLPSRHSLEVKDPDFLQVPQVVQIEHVGAPYIDDDPYTSNTAASQTLFIEPSLPSKLCLGPQNLVLIGPYTPYRLPQEQHAVPGGGAMFVRNDESCTVATEYESLEPAVIMEENEVCPYSSDFPTTTTLGITTPTTVASYSLIPTISASVAREPPPPDLNHYPYHHHHHHYPRYHHHHHHSQSSSYSPLLPLHEARETREGMEMGGCESSRLLPPEIVTTIAVEESSS